jgi:protein gp37
MKETEIAWTDSTFNPWWGCVKVSDGCKHCYAETFSKRVGLSVWGANAEHRRFGDKHWNEPLKWNREAAKSGKPWRVFCASMADVFEGRDEDAADRARLWALIEATPALTWLLLTKRPENMIRLTPEEWNYPSRDGKRPAAWPRNVWAGCTVEDQPNADRRVPELLRVPAAVRFLSVEPMLGPMSLRWLSAWPENAPTTAMHPSGTTNHLDGLRRLSWVIVGGESGPGARPFDLEWAAALSDQCRAAGVPYFFKQAGAAARVLCGMCGDERPCNACEQRARQGHPRGWIPLQLADRKGGDVNALAALLPDMASAGVFRREWPAVVC